MQKSDWLFKSAHILAVPIFVTIAVQSIFFIFKFSNNNAITHCFLVSIGIIMLMLGLLQSKKILSVALIFTGIWFLVYASLAIALVRYKISGIYVLVAWVIGLTISGYFYLRSKQNKGK
jgi:hypothetical protein